MAAPAAVVALDWALRPVADAVLLLVLAELVVDLAHKPLLLAPALLQVAAVLVSVRAVVVVELPLSRHSSSAAMARITIWPPPPYDPAPRSRWPPKGRPCPSP